MSPSGPASSCLFELHYSGLRADARLKARSERKNHTLQPTAIVHEAFLRLQDRRLPTSNEEFRKLFLTEMDRVLVDHARRKNALKRGGGQTAAALDEDLLAIRGAFSKAASDLLDEIWELDHWCDDLARFDAEAAEATRLMLRVGDVEVVGRVLQKEDAVVRAAVKRGRGYLKTRREA